MIEGKELNQGLTVYKFGNVMSLNSGQFYSLLYVIFLYSSNASLQILLWWPDWNNCILPKGSSDIALNALTAAQTNASNREQCYEVLREI